MQERRVRLAGRAPAQALERTVVEHAVDSPHLLVEDPGGCLLDLMTRGSIRLTPDSFSSPAEARLSNPHALLRTSQRSAGNSRARNQLATALSLYDRAGARPSGRHAPRRGYSARRASLDARPCPSPAPWQNRPPQNGGKWCTAPKGRTWG